VKAACLEYLRSNYIYFYPERTTLVQELRALAASLGGELEDPRFGWKYSTLQRLFGWRFAKRTQSLLPQCKRTLLSRWDQALARIEG
jgi:hypothetical protein